MNRVTRWVILASVLVALAGCTSPSPTPAASLTSVVSTDDETEAPVPASPEDLAGRPAEPNHLLTPGAVMTVDTKVVCEQSTSLRRDVSSATKDKVYKDYGITARNGYVIDHLIPLEIGGANDIANLWPEPTTSSKQKDVLEARLHSLVCANKLDVRTAQQAIASSWVIAYHTYVKK